jgi:hypothetical protein
MFGLNPIELLIVGFIATLIFGPRFYRHFRAIYDAAPSEARRMRFGLSFIMAIVMIETLLLAIMLDRRFGR